MEINVTKMEIKKVKEWADGTKSIIIPRKSDIKAGDWVRITKIEESA